MTEDSSLASFNSIRRARGPTVTESTQRRDRRHIAAIGYHVLGPFDLDIKASSPRIVTGVTAATTLETYSGAYPRRSR
jgi:hypothetical protein